MMSYYYHNGLFYHYLARSYATNLLEFLRAWALRVDIPRKKGEKIATTIFEPRLTLRGTKERYHTTRQYYIYSPK